ncbi:hypothetical protein F543_7120 [Bibersteinia trehalosi USDA-ARS-USMARC-189]|uniref:Uncharacterized protein n=1 Tax=Bibersteinia trehalosi USDA-ARS-USMARC-189 TaxID=1263831 RepID=A0ABN4BY51_BIBTR|nr:hypothetical protein WQG_16120 [Bibersteinia trehalosi USDA-ARS-USMARC-192]AHG83576.1 hypothetical protein F543_7120 [Bibersteinia trehalosi USDA-ARS-USMARC-189]
MLYNVFNKAPNFSKHRVCRNWDINLGGLEFKEIQWLILS